MPAMLLRHSCSQERPMGGIKTHMKALGIRGAGYTCSHTCVRFFGAVLKNP